MIQGRLMVLSVVFAAVSALGAASAQAQTAAAPTAAAAAAATPEQFITDLTNGTLDEIRADKAIQSGDMNKLMALVDTKVMPSIDFPRMTAMVVGRHWRTATPEQQKRLQDEFKVLLVRTYSGAVSQIKDQKVTLKPSRNAVDAKDVLIRSELKGKGEPIQIDYRLSKDSGAWKIYDFNVMGIWMVEQYKSSFSQEINASGLDGLIAKLVEKNKAAASGAKS